MNCNDERVRMEQCLASAQFLHARGDYDGTCNRAYYAMYHGVHAALIAIGEKQAAGAKTHHGLHANFAALLVRPGLLPKALGTKLTDVERRRLKADYLGDGASNEDAAVAIEGATAFVEAVNVYLAEFTRED